MTRWEEVLAMLGDLTRWVEEARERTSELEGTEETLASALDDAWSDPPTVCEPPGERVPDVDLSALVAELTALRHEVKLQTRSAHLDRQQAGESLSNLARAVERIEKLGREDDARLAAAVERNEAPWVELLVDLHDALSRSVTGAEEELQRIAALARTRRPPRAPGIALLPARWRRPPDPPVTGAVDEILRCVEGLVQGLRLGAARIERALGQLGVEPVESMGRLVDPEWMEVVRLACNETLPPDLVVAEVRRGYRRDGSVYRWAQVVANRPQAEACSAGNGAAPGGVAPEREE